MGGGLNTHTHTQTNGQTKADDGTSEIDLLGEGNYPEIAQPRETSNPTNSVPLSLL